MIYERPSPPLSPRHQRDPSEVSIETRSKLNTHRHNAARLPESQARADRPERVRIDRERPLRQEDRQRNRNDGGGEGRSYADPVDYHLPLERRLSSYERQSFSPNELPPPSPPSRDDYGPSTSGHDGHNYTRGSERTRTPSPSRNHNSSQHSRGSRAYGDSGDGRRLPARPRSPSNDVGERGYGKAETRPAMTSRGGSLLDRLSAEYRTGERDAGDRFDDRVAVTDVNVTSNGQDLASERRDNGRRRRKAKGGRR